MHAYIPHVQCLLAPPLPFLYYQPVQPPHMSTWFPRLRWSYSPPKSATHSGVCNEYEIVCRNMHERVTSYEYVISKATLELFAPEMCSTRSSVCMHVCVYVCMNMCVYVCMNMCVYVCMNMCVYVVICAWNQKHVLVYAWTCVCMYAWACNFIRICDF